MSTQRDDGMAVHYTAVTPGTPVISSDGIEVGKVVEVLDNYREHIFDGLIVDTGRSGRRFVDAPEVARTAELAVTLNITAADCERLEPPEPGTGAGPGPAGALKKLFGGLRRR